MQLPLSEPRSNWFGSHSQPRNGCWDRSGHSDCGPLRARPAQWPAHPFSPTARFPRGGGTTSRIAPITWSLSSGCCGSRVGLEGLHGDAVQVERQRAGRGGLRLRMGRTAAPRPPTPMAPQSGAATMMCCTAAERMVEKGCRRSSRAGMPTSRCSLRISAHSIDVPGEHRPFHAQSLRGLRPRRRRRQVLTVCAEDIVDHPGAEGAHRARTSRPGTRGSSRRFAFWPEAGRRLPDPVAERIVAVAGQRVVVTTRQNGNGRRNGVEVDFQELRLRVHGPMTSRSRGIVAST